MCESAILTKMSKNALCRKFFLYIKLNAVYKMKSSLIINSLSWSLEIKVLKNL